MCAVAAAATLSLTSCLSEEEVNWTKGQKGYISLNVTNDNSFVTRGVTDAPGTWNVFLTGKETKTLTVATLPTTSLQAGTYNVKVANLATPEAALDGYGQAYYEGTATGVTVSAGADTPVTIACGKSKNAKLTIESSVPATAALAITVNDATDSRELTFTKVANDAFDYTEAFFTASHSITIDITYNGVSLGDKAKALTLGAAGTENKIIITNNGNGTISVATISYDSDFENGNTQTINFDSATGEALSVTNSDD